MTKQRLTVAIAVSIFLLLTGIGSSALAADYYIDYEAGSDDAGGTTPETAWRHVPGDANAQDNAAAAGLTAGDRVLLKGGVVYRGRWTITTSGQEGRPVVFKGDGWPGLSGVKAIVDGSEVLGGTWQRCTSAAQCGGNPNHENIWWLDTTHTVDHPMAANLTENDDLLYVAQKPDPQDPLFPDNWHDDYRVAESVTSTTVTDNYLETIGGANLVGAWIYRHANGNNISFARITAYNAGSHTATFSPSIASSGKEYAILNSPNLITAPGEYTYNTDAVNGNHRIFLWPRSQNPNTALITFSKRENAIRCAGKSHVTVEGFTIRNFAGTGDAYPIFFPYVSASARFPGIVVNNNDIYHNRYTRYACISIYIQNMQGGRISNNIIRENPFQRGICLASSSDCTVENNQVIRPGGTAVMFMRNNRCRIVGNKVLYSNGVHANGITVYNESDTILVARNIVADSNIPLTLQGSGNIMVFGNVFSAVDHDFYIVANWGADPMYPTNILANNVVYNNVGAVPILLPEGYMDTWRLFNNIIDGNGGTENAPRSYNLYTNMRNWVTPSNWTPGQGEIVDLVDGYYRGVDPSTVFVDSRDYRLLDETADNDGLRLKAGSRAIGSGINFHAKMQQLAESDSNLANTMRVFADFDWDVDVAGNVRNHNGAWDMGPYAYSQGGETDTEKPSVPQAVTGSSTEPTAVQLSWTASMDNQGVSGYRIYRNSSFIAYAYSTSYVDTGLESETTYTYTVTAYDAAGNESDHSDAVQVTTAADNSADTEKPTVPQQVTGNSTEPTAVQLSWTASMDNQGVSGYRIYRNSSFIAYANSTSYVDTGLESETTYTYTVTAYDAAGNESAPSEAVRVTTVAEDEEDDDSDEGDNGGTGGSSGSDGSSGSGCFISVMMKSF